MKLRQIWKLVFKKVVLFIVNTSIYSILETNTRDYQQEFSWIVRIIYVTTVEEKLQTIRKWTI